MNSVLGIRSSATLRHQWTSEAPYDPPSICPGSNHPLDTCWTDRRGRGRSSANKMFLGPSDSDHKKKKINGCRGLSCTFLPFPHRGGNLGSPASAFFLLSAAKRPRIQGYAKKSFRGVGRGMRFLFPPPPDQKCGTLFVSWRQKRLSALIRSGGR